MTVNSTKSTIRTDSIHTYRPYFFSIKLLATTLKFTDQYLKSLGLPLSNTSNMLKDFRQDNLRDYF